MATDAPQVNVSPAATAQPAPLPGTNLVQVRAWVKSVPEAPTGSTIWIQQMNLHAPFERQVEATYSHLPRDIPQSRACWSAPWPWQARAAAVYQLVQPGSWSAGNDVAAGAQKLALEIVLEWQGDDGAPRTETVNVLEDGQTTFTVDWKAPRDYTFDVAVVDRDGQSRLAITLI